MSWVGKDFLFFNLILFVILTILRFGLGHKVLNYENNPTRKENNEIVCMWSNFQKSMHVGFCHPSVI